MNVKKASNFWPSVSKNSVVAQQTRQSWSYKRNANTCGDLAAQVRRVFTHARNTAARASLDFVVINYLTSKVKSEENASCATGTNTPALASCITSSWTQSAESSCVRFGATRHFAVCRSRVRPVVPD